MLVIRTTVTLMICVIRKNNHFFIFIAFSPVGNFKKFSNILRLEIDRFCRQCPDRILRLLRLDVELGDSIHRRTGRNDLDLPRCIASIEIGWYIKIRGYIDF